jgi:hypothetical protein
LACCDAEEESSLNFTNQNTGKSSRYPVLRSTKFSRDGQVRRSCSTCGATSWPADAAEELASHLSKMRVELSLEDDEESAAHLRLPGCFPRRRLLGFQRWNPG